MILDKKDIPKKLEEFDRLKKNENEIKNFFSKIKIDTPSIFVSINPIKIKLIIPTDLYDNDKNVSGMHPFGSVKTEVLKIKNKKDKLLYHLMDVGGYSNVSQDSESIKVINMNYENIKQLFKNEKIYRDLLKRYDNVVNRKDTIKILIHNITDTVLYIKNTLMQKLFPQCYIDEEKKYIYLFTDTESENDNRFKINYRTKGNLLFPKNEGESQLYSNIYPGRFGNNSINMNNVKEISSKGQKTVKLLIKNMKKHNKTKKSKKTKINKNKTRKSK